MNKYLNCIVMSLVLAFFFVGCKSQMVNESYETSETISLQNDMESTAITHEEIVSQENESDEPNLGFTGYELEESEEKDISTDASYEMSTEESSSSSEVISDEEVSSEVVSGENVDKSITKENTYGVDLVEPPENGSDGDL